jgi:uncharacterized phage-associated protein
MAFYDISPDELDEIRRYIENDGPVPQNDAIGKFNAMSAALNKKLYKDLLSARSKKNTLEKRVERFKAADEKRAQDGVFAETVPGLDSLTVARALVWCLNQKKTWKMSRTKVIAILYEMYASWLVSKHERLFEHHPQSTEYGPQLWRVYNHLGALTASYDEFKKLADQSPAIAAFCKNAAEKYYDVEPKKLVEPTKKSVAYKNALPEHNNGKWGKELSDADIYQWKQSMQNR